MSKKEYAAPTIRDWGTVTQLTQVGLTRPGTDAKSGSVLHAQGG
jgi:hypothetical protein